ncbi:hypothetical protein PSAC2689_40195 [Paraburkholderia sacchari]
MIVPARPAPARPDNTTERDMPAAALPGRQARAGRARPAARREHGNEHLHQSPQGTPQGS